MTDHKLIYLHIGTHKTGSTSLQRFLAESRQHLRRIGTDVYSGKIEPENHLELYLAAMRPERDSFAKQKWALKVDAEFLRSTIVRVREFIASSPSRSLIFTTEGLSLLRHPDEIERLRDMLDAPRHDVRVVLVLRNRQDFLQSYERQLLKIGGRATSSDPQSAFYVGPDSWLANFEELQQLYRKGFGPDALSVIDYDAEMRTSGNVLPAVIQAFGLDPSAFPGLDHYNLNAAPTSMKQRLLQKLKQAIASPNFGGFR